MADTWLDNANSNQLSKLLGLNPAQEDAWTDSDLSWSLKQFLDSPTPADPESPATPGRKPAPAVNAKRPDAPKTVRDVLLAASPDLETLKVLKVFAKSAAKRQGRTLPTDVATCIYHAAIAAAMVRLGERLTRLDDEAIVRSWRWALAQKWIDGGLRDLFTEGVAKLGDASG